MTDFPRLADPITLAGRRLRNRIGFAAMTSRMPRDGAVTPALVAHLSARAAGGAGLVVTEALAACRSAAVPARVAAWDEAQADGLARLAAAVEGQGAALLGQLWHAGNAHRDARALSAVGPSAVVDAASWTVPRALTDAEVEGLVEEYADSAARLQRAGFSGVEISAAHGFLPLQFLSPVTNLREDRWGGDALGRSAFTRAILSAIRARCGAGFIIGLKLPADDGVPGSIDPAEAARLTAAIVAETPPDLLCFSQGSHGPSLWMHAPDMHEPTMPFRAAWAGLRQAAGGVPLAGIGRIAGPAMTEALLASGDADLVMLARPLLADAAWPVKALAGRAAAIRPCIYCNACWGEIDRANTIACSVNPRGGTAADAAPPPPRAEAPRRVVVVGGGIAGMQAAAVAAERGHAVTLLHRGAALGGAARLHAALPGCGDIGRFLDHLAQRVAQAGVTLAQGESAAQVLALAPEAVVLATGAAMGPPRAPGLGGCDLRQAVAGLLAEQAPRAGLAVLFDHDHTAATYAAAELLLQRFDRLLLLTPRDGIARDVPGLYAQGVHRRLAAAGDRFEMLIHREPVAFAGGVLRFRHLLTGAETAVPGVALFTWSTPRRPDLALAPALQAAGLPVLRIGDAQAPRLMISAVRDGQWAGEAV
ncbi:NADH:flavin oxidoreductase [Falsiroseomonas selenitidurans]|uniref:FAD-dependent oxidoreductase n=1 Tax=Falsiroseomonas selenitidurans TaxID=2716335 RepID=A0ABX1E2H1_9PROT|nr:NADH:flavin oxidoreductase [Falsiroseomonas selenitidurans]NKC31206.1 FAD-dependent oxidoreductase [Falsiroseomonas selenitidurans]